MLTPAALNPSEAPAAALSAQRALAELAVQAALVPQNAPRVLPGRTDEVYVEVAVRPAERAQKAFNGESGSLLHHATVRGIDLRWPESRAFHAQLVDRRDLARVTIYADTLTLHGPMKLPGADVTVHARVVDFRGPDARIDTTPAGHAQPRASGSSEDGDDGQRGGHIRLLAGEIRLDGRLADAASLAQMPALRANPLTAPAAPYRLLAHGGAGQDGAAPVRTGEPPAHLAPIEVGALHEVIRSFGLLHGDPDDYAFPDLDRFKKGQVVHVNFMTVNAFALQQTPPTVTTTWLPGGSPTSKTLLPGVLESLWDAVPRGRKVPGAGRPARAGGKPGNGGRGGDITVSLPVLARSDGGPGGKTVGLAADLGGLPSPACHARVLAARKIFGQPLVPPRVSYEEVTAKPSAAVPEQAGGRGGAGAVRAEGASAWFSPEILGPLLRLAQDWFALGYRDKAREALAPYDFVGRGPIPAAGAGASPVVQLLDLGSRLGANLDYFGHPPGWVPRLNASALFSVLDTQLGANVELLNWSGAVLKDWDAVVDREQVLSMTQESLLGEQEALWKEITEARAGLAAVEKRLSDVDRQADGIALQMASFRQTLQMKAWADAERDRILAGASAVLAGLLELCPVGQPYVGAVAGVFKAVEGYALDDKHSIAKLGQGIATHLGTYMTEHKELFAADGNANLRRNILDARQRVRQLDDRMAELGQTIDSNARDQAFRKSWPARDKALNALDAFDRKRPKGNPADREPLAREVALQNAAWRELVLKDEQSGYEAQRKGMACSLERHKEDLAERDAATARTLQQLKVAASGVSDLLRGISHLSSSMRPDDPVILQKVDALIASLPPDSGLGEQYRKLVAAASEISNRRGELASAVLAQAGRISTALSGLAAGLAQMAQVSDQRRDVVASTLGAEMRSTFEAIQARSAYRIEAQLSAFIRAYQYEYLQDVGQDFKSLGALLTRTAAYRLRRVQPGSPLGGDPQRADDRTFTTQLIRNAYLELAEGLLRQRLQRPSMTLYSSVLPLTAAQRAQLAVTGRVRLNLVASGLVRLDDVKHRIRGVEIAQMALTTADPSNEVRVTLSHSGFSLLRDWQGAYFGFRAGPGEAPILWNWRYQAAGVAPGRPAWTPEVSATDDALLQEILKKLSPGGAAPLLREYSPSSFGDLQLTLSIGGVGTKLADVVRSVDQLEFKFLFEREPQALEAFEAKKLHAAAAPPQVRAAG